MTPDQIIAQFESLIQDTVDETTEYFLLNEAKDTIESERAWAILTGKDTSQSESPGDTYETAKTLPSDFFMPSPRGIYVGTDMIPYKQVPYEANIDFQAITYAYYFDYYNKQFFLCGSVSKSGTIKFFYRRRSPTLVKGGSAWIFPSQFHARLVYEMAAKYFALDQGEKARSWDDRWTIYANRIQENMNAWDDQLQTIPLQNEVNMFVDPSSFPNIVDMGSGSIGGVNG